jgi:hypothetical protein
MKRVTQVQPFIEDGRVIFAKDVTPCGICGLTKVGGKCPSSGDLAHLDARLKALKSGYELKD